jgi:hypothetical protein
VLRRRVTLGAPKTHATAEQHIPQNNSAPQSQKKHRESSAVIITAIYERRWETKKKKKKKNNVPKRAKLQHLYTEVLRLVFVRVSMAL